LENDLFPPDSKIKLNNHRVRQIKIRGLASQGMLINKEDIKDFINLDYVALEHDLKEVLNITKYEPPQPGFAQIVGRDKQRNKSYDHPMFHCYNGLNNIKWFPDLFTEGEEVVIQEKLHGTNARASLMPFIPNTFWKKLRKFFRIAPAFEKCYGSNNVQKQAAPKGKGGFYGEDLWAKVFKEIDVFSKIKLGESVYGEIIGPDIQKNYDYGLASPRFVLFDVKMLQEDGSQKWLNPDEVEAFAKERGFEYVPVLYKGAFNKDFAYALTKGCSFYAPSQKVREGIAIKARKDYDIEGNKKAVKWVSEDYLADDKNTDFH